MRSKVLEGKRQVSWAPAPNTLTCVVSAHMPDPVTSAVVMVFNEASKLLMVHVKARGWDLPGGHVEVGETPEQAAVREVAEESGVMLTQASLMLLGHQHLHVDAPPEPGSTYPHPDTYMPVFVAALTQTPPLGGSVPEEVDAVEFRDVDTVLADATRLGRTWAPLLAHVVTAGPHRLTHRGAWRDD